MPMTPASAGLRYAETRHLGAPPTPSLPFPWAVEHMRGRSGREPANGGLPLAGDAWGELYAIVKRIPRGRVATYGQIAELMDRALSARAVGWAMRQCPSGLSWHRVVNASGGCSTETLGTLPRGLQRALLEAEGVRFGANASLDLERYRWRPRRGAGGRARVRSQVRRR